MIYEFLIKDTAIITAQPQEYTWGDQECPPVFSIVPYDCSEADKNELLTGNYKYDEGFFHKETGLEFIGAITKQDAPVFEPVINDLATELEPNWDADYTNPCDMFAEKAGAIDNGGFTETRKYWFDKFYKWKDVEGMKAFLASIRYRDWGNIIATIRQFPNEQKQIFLNDEVFTEQDKTWLRWIIGNC